MIFPISETTVHDFTGRNSELERLVHESLIASHMLVLRTLRVHAENGVVTLSGRVRTYYEKQLAHACARRTKGVTSVIDAVSVVSPMRSWNASPRTSAAVQPRTAGFARDAAG